MLKYNKLFSNNIRKKKKGGTVSFIKNLKFLKKIKK